MRIFFIGCFAFATLTVACTKAPPPNEPIDVDGPVDCGKDRFKSKEHCFDHAQEACDWLKCAHGCDIHGARSSKMVICSFNEASSSHFTRCAGYANWLCPENMECAMSPDAQKIDDASGTCQPIVPGAPPAPAPPRICGAWGAGDCPTGMTCKLPSTHCFDCQGVCIANDAGAP